MKPKIEVKWLAISVSALWAAIAVGSVLGGLIELIEQNPHLADSQANSWSQEFLRVPDSKRMSRVESVLQGQTYSSARSQRGASSPPSHVPLPYDTLGQPIFNLRKRTLEAERIPEPSPIAVTGSSRTNINKKARKIRPIVEMENLEWMLLNVFSYPRSHITNETAKDFAKRYIVDSLKHTAGLEVSVQNFQPVQFLNLYDETTVPLGTNVIGVIKGKEWATPNDRPTVVGAHWDTVNFTPGTDDNGSGVAAMLEAARAITRCGCRPKYSLIFVAFDLEEVGSQGSLVFIKDYLMKVLYSDFGLSPIVNSNKFQGAFIMDTIMNFNDTEESQTFPTDWSIVLPQVYDEVADNKFRGDFLAMIYRQRVEMRMAEKFQSFWAKSADDSDFKLSAFPLSLEAELPSLEVLSGHLNLLRSDHARFWYMNDTEIPHTLEAILMTDTGPYRGNMRNCYHTVCDGPEINVNGNPKNMKFLAKITQVLTDTIVDMSECRLQTIKVSNSSSTSPKSNANNYSRRTGLVTNTSSTKSRPLLRNLFNFVKWMTAE